MSDPVASVAPFSIINGNIALHVVAEAYPEGAVSVQKRCLWNFGQSVTDLSWFDEQMIFCCKVNRLADAKSISDYWGLLNFVIQSNYFQKDLSWI